MFAFASCALAQDLRTATLVGTVTDASGAAVANAQVLVTNTDTDLATRTKTNDTGAYYVPFLNIGNYQLVIESPGFRKFEQTGLVLNAGETPRIDVKLEVGAVTDEVKVTAQAALLETDSAVVGIRDPRQRHSRYPDSSIQAAALYVLPGRRAGE